MICVLCRHEESEHAPAPQVMYCWSCNKQWPSQFKTVHDFTDNLKYLEQLYNQKVKTNV